MNKCIDTANTHTHTQKVVHLLTRTSHTQWLGYIKIYTKTSRTNRGEIKKQQISQISCAAHAFRMVLNTVFVASDKSKQYTHIIVIVTSASSQKHHIIQPCVQCVCDKETAIWLKRDSTMFLLYEN